MNPITFAPAIYKQYKKKDGTVPVRIRVSFNRKTKIISTNIVARPDQLTRDYSIKDYGLMTDVENLLSRLRDAANKVLILGGDADIDDVVRRVMSKMADEDGFRLDFLEYARKIADEKPKYSRENYMCAIRSFRDYIGSSSIDISQITSALLNKYEAHLRKTYGDNARAVSLYLGAIAHIHRRAQKEFNSEEAGEMNVKNPFAFYTVPKQRPSASHRDVSLKVVQQMIKLRTQLGGRERRAVDAFLLSFALMGMNAPDLLTCRPPKDGILIYNRQKTCKSRPDKAEMHVRIEPCIRPIFDEWADNDGEHAFIFHRFHENHKQFTWALAKGLKQYRGRVGIPDGDLDFYSARHTWGTTAYSVGISEGVVNDCLCHVDADMKVTDIYIRKDWSVMWKANAKVLKQLKWR